MNKSVIYKFPLVSREKDNCDLLHCVGCRTYLMEKPEHLGMKVQNSLLPSTSRKMIIEAEGRQLLL